jgi:hypothetical protein
MPTPEHLEAQIQALEERPDPSRLLHARQQARVLMETHAITVQTWSELLARMSAVSDRLKGSRDA